jgi:hypothetical protein
LVAQNIHQRQQTHHMTQPNARVTVGAKHKAG